jgi:UDP-N-acetyl-D-glucosamine dehydrogenase
MSERTASALLENGRTAVLSPARTTALDRFSALLAAIDEKRARVGVVGLGYVGLPMARACAEQGFRVLGFDSDREKVATLQRGESYIGHIPDAVIAEMRGQRRFEATSRLDLLAEPDVIIICVPTPLTESREPDLHFLLGAAQAIASHLRPGQLIVLESTTYPGTTRHEVQPILETSGLKAGTDFFLAFSPEREDPGNRTYDIKNIPKVVSGIDARSLELAACLYEQLVVRVVRVSSPEVAEACKILENTYRAVNIGLINNLKVVFDRLGIDVWEVIEAARTKPFGFEAFYPGPGWGGPCIPKDPYYLAWIARKHDMPTPFIELAGEVNRSMPQYVVQKTAAALNARSRSVKGSKIAVLGMAYKKDVNDPRDSPGYAILDQLLEMGALVSYNDPHLSRLPAARHYPRLPLFESQPLTRQYLEAQDCVLIVTNHSAYDWPWVVENSQLVVDTRDATRGVTSNRERIVRA